MVNLVFITDLIIYKGTEFHMSQTESKRSWACEFPCVVLCLLTAIPQHRTLTGLPPESPLISVHLCSPLLHQNAVVGSRLSFPGSSGIQLVAWLGVLRVVPALPRCWEYATAIFACRRTDDFHAWIPKILNGFCDQGAFSGIETAGPGFDLSASPDFTKAGF